ncbi:Transcriptional regulator of ribosomal biogenesis protein [Mortierella alpina]|uniref:Transcriptional regulator of ribosomal biogenesis protein n=1 Tax=Mortierella alpina TaxID=64518 RepID=A0A9P6JBI7_MORAP|nr:Transcriptional regulator of ribosomal biogenesis protein [Mortierella alpina]
MPAAIPTPSISITQTPASHSHAAHESSSSFSGSLAFRRPSLALSVGSFHSAQLRRPSFFAPFPYSQSPQQSDSSSSRGDVYERDLEANYCKNFSCCGLTLGDLHALLQHYEEAHVRFEEDEDEDLLGAGFTDDDGWSTNSESAPNSPQMGGSRQIDNAFLSASAATAAAAATVAALTAATTKLTPMSLLNAKRKANGVSLSDIYSDDSIFIPDEALSAFPNSILRASSQAGQPCRKRDLAMFSSSYDVQSPITKKAAMLHNNRSSAAMGSDLLSLSAKSSGAEDSSSSASAASPGTQDELMNTVTGYLEHAIQNGLLPNCGEVGSPAYLLAAEDLLRKRDEIVSMMESIGRSGTSGADKPYRCSVSGCDKAYKNANGLKYHNQHGHCSQSGASEEDKLNAKPYRCTFLECGKCYKNLNGLKYHIEHSHPNLAALLHANIPGFAALDGSNASQAAIAAAAAIAAVKGDSIMMSAINAIMASSNNSSNRAAPPTLLSDQTPESSPNSSPVLGPVGSSDNRFAMDLTPMSSPVLSRAVVGHPALSIQTTIGGTKDSPLKMAGLMTPASLSPTLTVAPKSPSQISALTAALQQMQQL